MGHRALPVLAPVMRRSASLVLLGALAASSATAQTERECFTGYAYHRDSGAFVYTEHHEQTLRDGRAIDWRITYRDPNGAVIAEKTLDFSDNRFVPTYTLRIPEHDYLEGIRHDDGVWRMIRRKDADAARESEAFETGGDLAADSGFHPFVQARFDELMAGEKIRFEFAAAGRQAVIDMRAKRIADATFENEPAVRFKAELDMFLINWFVDALVLTYDPDDKRLLEYRGITNLLNDEGNRYPVRVSYYDEKPPEARAVSATCGG